MQGIENNPEFKASVKGFINKVVNKNFTQDDILKFCKDLIYKSSYFHDLSLPKTIIPLEEKSNSTLGSYCYGNNSIEINTEYYYDALMKNPTDIVKLMDTVGHEMTHAAQYLAKDVFALNRTMRNNGKIRVSRRLGTKYLDLDQLGQMFEYAFLMNGPDKRKPETTEEMRTRIAELMHDDVDVLQDKIKFGSYLNEEYELDARKGGETFAYVVCNALMKSADRSVLGERELYSNLLDYSKKLHKQNGVAPTTIEDNQAYKKLVREAKKLTLEQLGKFEEKVSHGVEEVTYKMLSSLTFSDCKAEELCKVIKYALDNRLNYMLENVIDIYSYNCAGNPKIDSKLSRLVAESIVSVKGYDEYQDTCKEKRLSTMLVCCGDLLSPEDAKSVMKVLCSGGYDGYDVYSVFEEVLSCADYFLKKESTGDVLDGMSKYEIVSAVLKKGKMSAEEDEYLKENMNNVYEMLSYNCNFVKKFVQTVGESCIEKVNGATNEEAFMLKNFNGYSEMFTKLDELLGDETSVYRDVASRMDEKVDVYLNSFEK